MESEIFVGRDHELGQLRASLRDALTGHGQTRFVAGQAGSGKTSLIRHFVQEALNEDPNLIVAVGTSNAQAGVGDPYLPFREALTALTGSAGADNAAGGLATENSTRLKKVMVRSVQVLVEAAPELVGLFVPGASLVGALGKAVAHRTGWMDKLDELARRAQEVTTAQSRVFEQYTGFLQRLSDESPLVLFLDDLQWSDNSSIALLFHLARHIEKNRILIIGAYRATDVALGRAGARHPLTPVINELTRYYGDIIIDLDQIPEAESRQFVQALVDAEHNCLGATFREALFEHTGGHALFTVELLRALQARGDLVPDSQGCWVETPSLDWTALPVRVEGVIQERVGRLEEDMRQMLSVASVEGEHFHAEVIAPVDHITAREAVRTLSGPLSEQHRLVKSEGMVQVAQVRLSQYRFEHNLFQDYMYANLSEAEKSYLHQDVGAVMEKLFSAQTEEVAAQLARHFERAGIPDKAAAYRLQAGNKAHRFAAEDEAIMHLRRGLELLEQLPPGEERSKMELRLLTSLGTVLVITRGYAAPEVQDTFSRVQQLSENLADPELGAPALYGLCTFRFVRGEINESHAEAERLLLSARQSGYIPGQMRSFVVMGFSSLYMGQYDRAREYLEQVPLLYDSNAHRELAYSQGQDPAVAALSVLSWVLWHQGDNEQALVHIQSALDLAQSLNHPYSLAYVNFFAAVLLQMIGGRDEESRAHAEAAVEIARKRNFPVWLAYASIIRGGALAKLGDPEVGSEMIAKSIALLKQTGAAIGLPYFHALLAESYLLAGRKEEGLEALEGASCCPEQVWWTPELYRLRAQLLLLEPNHEAEAEGWLRQAIHIAQSQQAVTLQARAAADLAGLVKPRGELPEGHTVPVSTAQ